jgi:hypothetical protein
MTCKVYRPFAVQYRAARPDRVCARTEIPRGQLVANLRWS